MAEPPFLEPLRELGYHRRDEGAAVAAIDARFAPIYLSTFRGRLSLELVRWHSERVNQVLDKALNQGRPAYYVTDARAMDPPSATIRQHWADALAKNRPMMSKLLGTVIVMDSPVLRGALTAINWLTGKGSELAYVATLSEAITEGNRRLVAAGYSPSKLDPFRYELPPA